MRKGDGAQIGVEAKLQLNARVVLQALPHRQSEDVGPDYRAVLVPALKLNYDLCEICKRVGIAIIALREYPGSTYYGKWSSGPAFVPELPKEPLPYWNSDWHEYAPSIRCEVPDYIPDVAAGASAPLALTKWKIKAIKLTILLKERPVTRADFKHFELSPSFWLAKGGWLVRTPEGWVAGPRTPSFEKQHPRNYAEIEADKAKWMPPAPGGAAGGAAPAEQGALL